jgi:hypothetical protein
MAFLAELRKRLSVAANANESKMMVVMWRFSGGQRNSNSCSIAPT